MPQLDSPSKKTNAGFARQFALAMELPFLLAGGVFAGGLLGYFLDRWLHTKPYLMLLLGIAGFLVSIRDMLRRLQRDGSDKPSNTGH